MADGLMSDAEFGLPTASPSAASAPAATPSAPAAAPTGDPTPSLTIHGHDPAPAAPTAPALMSDAEFGLGVPSSDASGSSTLADVAKSIPSGLAKGAAALAGTPRAIHDLAQTGVDWLGNQTVGRVASYLKTGSADAPTLADSAAARAAVPAWTQGQAPSAADVQGAMEKATGPLYEPQTLPGQLVGKTAEFLPSTALGGGTLLSKLLMAGGSAVGDSVAGGVTQGTSAEPYARMAGAIVGGGLAGAAGHAAESVAPAVSGAAARNKAADLILGSANDPAALRAAAAAPLPADLVTGSKPTSFQAFGDVGLGNVERAMQTRNPQAFVENPYGTGTAQQNGARVAALQGFQGPGDPMAMSNLFRAQKADLEDFHDVMSHVATSDARGQADALGGIASTTQTGQAIKSAIDPQFQAAQGTAQSSAAALGGTGRIDAYGATLRASAKAAADAANDRLGDLFDAVPDDVVAPIGGLKQAATSLYANPEPAVAAGITPQERAVSSAISAYPDAVPFSQARNIDTLITGSMRQELKANGSTPAYRRLVQLKGAWEDGIHGALTDQAGADDDAVAAGTMAPADHIGAKIQAVAPGSQQSMGSVAYTPAGTHVGTDMGVVDMGDLITSHMPDGNPNPAYPQALQPRDRTRAASQAQVSDIASRLQPERLGASMSTADGAPIVGPDGVVESGNGRTLALGQAYRQAGPQADAYRQFLTDQGYDITGLPRPVLVRQRTTPMSDAERANFARESNAPTASIMSATERAATDSGRMSDATLSGYQGGDVTSAENRPFVRSFMGSVPDAGERGALAAADGSLSMEGATRVRNALLHAGYGDSGLVSSLAETGDPDIAAFGRSLQDNAGRMAQLRRGIASGDVHPGADLSAPAVEAARVVQRARSTGQRLGDAVGQADAFNPISREAHSLLQAGYGDDLSGRFSRARMNSVLQDAIGEAQQQTAGTRLFGEPLAAGDILQGAKARYGSRQSTGTADPIADGAGHLGPSAGAGSAEGGQPPSASRGATGTDGRQGGQAGRQAQGLSAADLESRVFHQSVPADPGHQVVPVNVDKVDALTGWQPDYRIAPGSGGKLDRASTFIRGLPEGQEFRPPQLGVHDQGMGFDDGRHRFAAMRDLGFKTAPASMDPQSIAYARRLGLIDDAPPKPGAAAGRDGRANSPGRSILPGAAPSGPPIDQASLDALTAAKQLTKDNVATFKKGPVGSVLRSDGTSGSYRIADSAVPDAVFPKGANGYQAVQAYRRAVGDDGDAASALQNYAASTLRKTALQDDGTLSPAGFARWRNSYSEAFRALPQAVRDQFSTAGNAASALDRFGKYSPTIAPTSVPEMFFQPGKGGAAGVRQLRDLMGDDHADAALSDHAAAVLKAKAERPDGTIDPRGLQQFMTAHKSAMSEFPQLAARFGSAAKATQTIADVAAGRAQALKNFQSTAAGKFMGYTDPSEVRDAVGRMIGSNNVTGLRGLVKQASADPDAAEGVKRAAADFILRDALSASAEAGASGVKEVNKGTLQNLINDNHAALGTVFNDREMGTLSALSQDIMRSQRSVNALKMKGTSNTAPDALRALKFEPPHRESVLRQMVEGAIGGGELGGEHGSLAGAGLAVGNAVKNAIRDAGMRRTHDVLERAVLDPAFMQEIVRDAPLKAGTGSHVTLANRLARYSMFRGAQAQTAAQDDRKAH